MQETRTEIRRRTLQEQTIKNNFVFGAVMLEEQNCRELLSLVLGTQIPKVEVIREKSVVYNPEYRGVRLDVYAKAEDQKRYNIEMQVVRTEVELRARYYHSQMDMELLEAGHDYEELPEVYVIFICDYDPLGKGKYVYTVDSLCRELPGFEYRDGVHTLILSTKGRNGHAVPGELVKFLEYVGADPEEAEGDFGSAFVRQLQESVRKIKRSRDMTEKYNAFEHIHSDAWREGRREGREEGRQEGREEGAGLVNQLNVRLSKDGRVDDIVRAASDKEFQQQLMKEFKLVPDTTQIR